MIRMPAPPNTAPAGCDFDAELLADAGARRGGQPHVASAVSRAVSAGQPELVEHHGVDLDNGLASDIDLLVEFQPEHTPGLLHLAQMELELEDALGRPVELRTPEDLSPYFRDQVTSNARSLYAA
jgi:hypothetical protein